MHVCNVKSTPHENRHVYADLPLSLCNDGRAHRGGCLDMYQNPEVSFSPLWAIWNCFPFVRRGIPLEVAHS